jgi:hypothetical protein
MSSIDGLSGKSSDVLALLRQRQAEQKADASGTTTGSSEADVLLAMISSAQNGAGDGSAAPGTSADSLTGTNGGQLDVQLVAVLLKVQEQQGSDQGQDPTAATDFKTKLFDQMDTDGNGSLSQSEFEADAAKRGRNAAGADAFFAKLDTNGDGQVSMDELQAFSAKGHGHGHGGGLQDALEQLLQGQSSDDGSAGSNATQSTVTVTNADGSTTTTITFADGSKVSTSTAPTQSDNGNQDQPAGHDDAESFQAEMANLLKQLTSAFDASNSAFQRASMVDQSV